MSQLDGRFLKDFWEVETPSGLINGSNTSFTLAHAPMEPRAVGLFLDGLFQTYTTDFTISGTTITMVAAPAVGQSLVAWYIRERGE